MTDAPADVRNGRRDILAANRLGYALYSELFIDPVRPANVARFVFLSPRAREFFPDWEGAANDLVANLRIEAGRNPHDWALQDLVGELSTRSQEFRTHVVGPCQGVRSCFLLVDGQVTPAAAGVKVERPAGRAPLTPARTGAGSGDEKARDGQSTEWSRKHPFGPPSWEDPHDVGVRAGLLSQLIGRVAGHAELRAHPAR